MFNTHEEKRNDLDSKSNLPLSFELGKNRNHIHLEKPHDMGFDKLIELLFVVFESLETLNNEKGFFADEFLASP